MMPKQGGNGLWLRPHGKQIPDCKKHFLHQNGYGLYLKRRSGGNGMMTKLEKLSDHDDTDNDHDSVDE